MPRHRLAPLPRLCSFRSSTSGRPATRSCVPSVEPSSTTITVAATASARAVRSAIVAASFQAGITTA